MSRTARLVLTFAALLGSSAPRALAQEPAAPPPIIDSLVVEGAVRNTPRQVLDYAQLRRGEPANYRAIQRAITALFGSGQFDDVGSSSATPPAPSCCT
jgi:outer membrane protein assembly factor BamA